MNPNGPIEIPDLRALLNAHRDEVFASLNCHQLGTVVAFDKDRQTASVTLNAKRVVFDKPQTENAGLQQEPRVLDYPVLTDVPVFVLSGGTARITFPIAAGDTCLVLFNDRDVDAWFATGVVAAPNSPRMHSLSDGIALVGIRSLANKIDDYSGEDAEFRLGASVVRIKPDGVIELARGTSVMRVALDGAIELEQGGASIKINEDGSISVLGGGGGLWQIFANGGISFTAQGGTEISLSDKIGASNSATSLRALFDSLITALTALDAKTGPSAAAQIALAQVQVSELIS